MLAFGLVVDNFHKPLSGGQFLHGINILFENLTIPYKIRVMIRYVPIRISAVE